MEDTQVFLQCTSLVSFSIHPHLCHSGVMLLFLAPKRPLNGCQARNPIQGSCMLQRHELSTYVINYWTLLGVAIKEPDAYMGVCVEGV